MRETPADKQPEKDLGTSIRERFAPLGGVELPPPWHEWDRVEQFDEDVEFRWILEKLTGRNFEIDQFGLGPAVFLIVGTLIVGIIRSLSPMEGLVLSLFWLITLLGWAVLLLLRAIFAVKKFQWRRAISLLVFPVAALPLLPPVFRAGDYIHFATAYPAYIVEIAKVSSSGDKSVSFDWGGDGFGGTGSSRTLVYDPTGALGLRPKITSLPDSIDGSRSTRHFFHDFYLVEDSW